MPWATHKAPKGDRGYGYQYQKLRKALLPAAYGTPCVRCGQPMLPGQKLHLDHDDYDRTKLRGFAHADGCGGFVRHRLLASSETAGHVSVSRMLVCVDTASAPDGCQVVRCFVAWARR